jgi:hypothetical protein
MKAAYDSLLCVHGRAEPVGRDLDHYARRSLRCGFQSEGLQDVRWQGNRVELRQGRGPAQAPQLWGAGATVALAHGGRKVAVRLTVAPRIPQAEIVQQSLHYSPLLKDALYVE